MHARLCTEFHRYDDRSHFFSREDVEELLNVILNKVREINLKVEL